MGTKHNICLRPDLMLSTWVWLCQTITQAGDQLDLLVKGHKSVKTITYKAAQTLVIQSRTRTIFTSSFGYHVYGQSPFCSLRIEVGIADSWTLEHKSPAHLSFTPFFGILLLSGLLILSDQGSELVLNPFEGRLPRHKAS